MPKPKRDSGHMGANITNLREDYEYQYQDVPMYNSSGITDANQIMIKQLDSVVDDNTEYTCVNYGVPQDTNRVNPVEEGICGYDGMASNADFEFAYKVLRLCKLYIENLSKFASDGVFKDAKLCYRYVTTSEMIGFEQEQYNVRYNQWLSNPRAARQPDPLDPNYVTQGKTIVTVKDDRDNTYYEIEKYYYDNSGNFNHVIDVRQWILIKAEKEWETQDIPGSTLRRRIKEPDFIYKIIEAMVHELTIHAVKFGRRMANPGGRLTKAQVAQNVITENAERHHDDIYNEQSLYIDVNKCILSVFDKHLDDPNIKIDHDSRIIDTIINTIRTDRLRDQRVPKKNNHNYYIKHLLTIAESNNHHHARDEQFARIRRFWLNLYEYIFIR